ncbi:MAG: hypothetical protein Q8942_19690 [Bacillota bacterium]|nr:hypothetical protein [Bacillota bacterium]
MNSNFFISIIIVIGLTSVLATIIIALQVKRNRFFKYLPAIITGALAILFCAVITFINYNKYGGMGYIGLVYVVVFMIAFPPVLISLLTAACFDLFKKRY